MKAITSKWKTWSVIFVVILFVGMVLFGVTGLNKSINAKEHYELQVKVVHIQDADKELLQNSVENYFKDNSLAIGPAVIIATVLFAVKRFIIPASAQIPNSQVFLFLINLSAVLKIKVIPPL